MRISLLIPALLLVAVGCDSADSGSAQVQIEADLSLELGATATSDGLTITFEEVLGDSRCPVDVACFWAGTAEVRLRIDGETVDLWQVAGIESSAPARVAGVEIRLLDLSPYPGTPEAEREDTPVATLMTEAVER